MQLCTRHPLDTLLGFRLSPWRKRVDRRLVETEKFYLVDVGVANYLARRRPAVGTPEFGNSFEQLILMELTAYRAYRNSELEISFWRTSSGLEVDFILDAMKVAIEVKAKRRISSRDVAPLRALAEEQPAAHLMVVSLEDEPRTLADGIEVLPWRRFLDRLWGGLCIAISGSPHSPRRMCFRLQMRKRFANSCSHRSPMNSSGHP